jgi:L-cystine uptake protein TcyP (sodium:dicarboxylate symporter family)
MSNQKQSSIEKTLLIGLGLGLLIGFLSKRIAYGLLLGIGLTFLISYLMKPKEENRNKV